MRLSMDCKATVNIGDYSRGGKTRGDNQAADHDMGCEEKHTPFGVVNEDSGSLHQSFGSSAKTSDFIIDSLYAWGACQAPEECARVTHTRTMLKWAKSMTWKGVHPAVQLSRTAYEKGITVAKDAIQAVESRL